MHHIIFRSQRGPDLSFNLITLCNSCHDGIHTAIKDGEHGLVITQHDTEVIDANLAVQFRRAPWWKPGQ